MNRYWDLGQSERAELTEEQVTAFIDVELMEQGVLKPEPPVLQEVVDIELPMTRVYEIHADGRYGNQSIEIGFASESDAAAFLKLNPLIIESDYDTDTKFCRPLMSVSFQPAELTTHQSVLNAKQVLESNKAKKSANIEAESEYSITIKAVNHASDGVWDDWISCRAHGAKVEQVRSTYTEYCKLTDGDDTIARSFLQKAYTGDLIEEALGIDGEAPVQGDVPL